MQVINQLMNHSRFIKAQKASEDAVERSMLYDDHDDDDAADPIRIPSSK